jgi:nucleotide-binding universal stress UspA family protein
MGVTNIVCGVTASTHAQKAALEAALLAKKESAGLIYVYAVDVAFLKGGIADTGAVEASLMRLGGQIVDLAEQIALAHGVQPKKIVRKGPVLEVLKQVIIEEKGDVLMIGHEERTFFEKAMLKGAVENHVDKLKEETGVEVKVVR